MTLVLLKFFQEHHLPQLNMEPIPGPGWVFTQDECKPICLACWKSLKFVKNFAILRKQMHLIYCPGSYACSFKFSSIYLFSRNLYEFLKKNQFFLTGERSSLRPEIRYLLKHVNQSGRISLQPIYQKYVR